MEFASWNRIPVHAEGHSANGISTQRSRNARSLSTEDVKETPTASTQKRNASSVANLLKMVSSSPQMKPFNAFVVCELKPDSGPCKALGYRWYFNPTDGECQQFRYGGCRGNGNNFKTRAECQEACRNGKQRLISVRRSSCFVDCLYVRCAGHPCEENKCPAFPDAKCVANYCRGCNADFFVNGKLVDCSKHCFEPHLNLRLPM